MRLSLETNLLSVAHPSLLAPLAPFELQRWLPFCGAVLMREALSQMIIAPTSSLGSAELFLLISMLILMTNMDKGG